MSSNKKLTRVAPTPGKPPRANADNTNTTNTPAANDLATTISPPGMRLRSGRKKKPTPLKTKGSRDEEDEDEVKEQEEVDDEQEEEEVTSIKRGNKRKLSDTSDHDKDEEPTMDENSKVIKKAKMNDDESPQINDNAVDMEGVENIKESNDEEVEENEKEDVEMEMIQPSITNVKLRLPSQHTPAKPQSTDHDDDDDDKMKKDASNDMIVNSASTAVESPPQPRETTNGNTRERNFFTPFVKKTKLTAEEEEPSNSPLSSFQQRLEQSTESTNQNPIPPQREQQHEGRVNGLFHYYFKRTIDRLTPIPVQFNTTTTNTDGILRPEPIRAADGGVHLDHQLCNITTSGTATTDTANKTNNGKGEVGTIGEKDDHIIVRQQNEEVDDDADADSGNLLEQDDATSSSKASSSTTMFHSTWVWLLLLHVIYGLLLGGFKLNMNGAIMAIPNAVRYQHDILYSRSDGTKDPLVILPDDNEAICIDDSALDANMTDIQEYREEEEEEEPFELEPIIEYEEEIVQEITYNDNIELEETERELLRQRSLIKVYQEEQSFLELDENKLLDAKRELGIKWTKFLKSASHIKHLKSQLDRLEASLKQSSDSLSYSESVLSESKKIMEQLLEEDSNTSADKSKHIDAFKKSLSALRTTKSIRINTKDLDMVPIGSAVAIPGEGCRNRSNIFKITKKVRKITKRKLKKRRKRKIMKMEKPKRKVSKLPFIDMDDAAEAADLLNSESKKVLEKVAESSKLAEVTLKWFSTLSKDYFSKNDDKIPQLDNVEVAKTDNLPKEEEPLTSGISRENIQVIIDRLKEIEMADSTGKYDYAAIGNGASVIRSGTRKTSLSIVDNLPFINRILSKASLKFYGHGAEAALIPTFPKTALGQCWSFEEEGGRKQLLVKEMVDENELIKMEDEISRGMYATLSVRFAKPIQVNSVIIEHPSKLLSETSRESAIRNFRVIGYMDENAKQNPWNLGSFEYKTDGNDSTSLQEFEVKTVDESGMPIPKLSSITLAIDDNWGGEHTCLYRFRVHGK